MSPRPNATRVNPATTIAVRFGGEEIASHSLNSTRILVTGSSSGLHEGTVVLSDDHRTIIFRPAVAFLEGEHVGVEVRPGIVTEEGTPVPPWSFSFTIRNPRPPHSVRPEDLLTSDRSVTRRSVMQRSVTPRSVTQGSVAQQSGKQQSATQRSLPDRSVSQRPVADRSVPPQSVEQRSFTQQSAPARSAADPQRSHELPPDFPAITILKNADPTRNPIFLGSFNWGADSSSPYMMILNRDGSPQFYMKVNAWDFTVQPNGYLTFYHEDSSYFMAMDSAYQLIDYYACGNGYNTNEHELRLMPNGHAWLMSYDGQEVAMDTIVPGGNPHALVFGLIIQELDRDKNVVFEWRSWDHLAITDATHEDLTSFDIDYVHGNAIEIDPDGNILISCRNMDEITKIDHETGEIIWRMGGKNNQFTFINDPTGFEYQHAIRRLSNGNVMIFDNGTFRGYARAVEYALEETTKTATQVWEYRHNPDVPGWALGYSQRLPDGNTLVGWGSANPTATEVSPSGQTLFEFDLPPEVYTYRAYSFPWRTTAFVPATDTLVFPSCPVGDSTSAVLTINNPTAVERNLTSLEVGLPDFSVRTPVPVYLPPGGSAEVEIAFIPGTAGAFRDTLELWSTDTTSGIMQRVVLKGGTSLPELVFAPPIMDFGEVVRGDSVTRSITVHNLSTRTVTLASAVVSGTQFSVHTGMPLVLNAKDSATIEVRFAPATPGVFQDTVRFGFEGVLREVRLLGISRDPAVSVGHDSTFVPAAFLLAQNYPNPFNPTSEIRYQLAEFRMVRLVVYDLLGREVAVLVNDGQPAGYYGVRFDAQGLSSGVYLYRLTAGDFIQSRRMILVR